LHSVEIDDYFQGVKIKTITHDTNGDIWAGTDGRGILYRETKTVDSIVVSDESPEAIPLDTIQKTMAVDHIIDTAKGLPSNWIRKIHPIDSVMWAATYASGIVKFTYDTSKSTLKTLKTYGKKQGLDDLLIREMKTDAYGRLWYATQKGHLGYIQNDKLTDLGKVLDQEIPIGTLLFHNENLYLGTSGSGIWWSPINDLKRFGKLSGNKSPYSENIYQLIFDADENLWVGTERGVDKIILSQENTIIDVFHFGENDGFLGIETCLNAVDIDVDGNLWFGAIYGLTQHQASETIKATVKPKLYFEQIEVDYKTVDSLHLKKWTNSPKTLLLPRYRFGSPKRY